MLLATTLISRMRAPIPPIAVTACPVEPWMRPIWAVISHRHRQSDQPAGAERHHRGGPGRRGRTRLRGRRRRLSGRALDAADLGGDLVGGPRGLAGEFLDLGGDGSCRTSAARWRGSATS
jgi:hypothetical protein